jgi:hypothetical protein
VLSAFGNAPPASPRRLSLPQSMSLIKDLILIIRQKQNLSSPLIDKGIIGFDQWFL